MIRQVPEWLKIAACLGSNYAKLLFIFQFRFVFPQASTVFFYYYLLFIRWKTCAINKNLHASSTTTTITALGTGFLLLLLLVNEFFIFTNITNLAWVDCESRLCLQFSCLMNKLYYFCIYLLYLLLLYFIVQCKQTTHNNSNKKAVVYVIASSSSKRKHTQQRNCAWLYNCTVTLKLCLALQCSWGRVY